MKAVRLGVLASGGGTNLQALLDADLGPGTIEVVLSNVPGCGALERAQKAGIKTELLNHKAYKKRKLYDQALVDALAPYQLDYIVLAGFMRILTPVLLDNYPQRVINIHPSLLPAFPGLDAQGQAFAAGTKLAGCTVHLVDAGVDSGPILAQAAVPVLASDDAEALRLRILAQEHQIFPATIRAVCEGRLKKIEQGYFLDSSPQREAFLQNPSFIAGAKS